jgi:tRNA A37 threonylcarbamoyladenosine modification protein TsaB
LLDNPRPGVIASVVDARHGQVYFQLFESKGRQILAPRVASLRDAVRAIGSGPVRIVGDAAAALAEEALRAGAEADASDAVPFPDIVALARIGLAADPAAWPPRPLYVKPPDAHPASGYAVARDES